MWFPVIFFLFGISTMSFLMSIPLLAVNNSIFTCFTTLFLCSLCFWFVVDNMRLHHDISETILIADETKRLNGIIKTLQCEKDLLQQEIAFLKVKYSLLKQEQWNLGNKTLGGVSCRF